VPKKRVYEQIHDGEWFRPQLTNNFERCCDCALVHRVEYRIIDGHIEIRCWRDERKTSALRRKSRLSVSERPGITDSRKKRTGA